MKCYRNLIFPSDNDKKMGGKRPPASQKNVNAAPLKWYIKKMARDFSVKLIENVQQ